MSLEAEESAPCTLHERGWECHVQPNRALIRTSWRFEEMSDANPPTTDVYLRAPGWDVAFCDVDGGGCIGPAGEPELGYRVFRNCGSVGTVRLYEPTSATSIEVGLDESRRAAVEVVEQRTSTGETIAVVEAWSTPTRARAWLGTAGQEYARLEIRKHGERRLELLVPHEPLRSCRRWRPDCAVWLQVAHREVVAAEHDLDVERSTEVYGMLALEVQ